MNSQALECVTGVRLNGENNSIEGGSYSSNDTNVLIDTAAEDTVLSAVSLDDANTYHLDCETTNGSDVNLFGVHFENAGQEAYTDMILVGQSCTVNLFGGMLYENRTTGTQTELVKVNHSGASFNAYGVRAFSAGRTITDIVNFSASGATGTLYFHLVNAAPFSGIFTSPTDGRVFDFTRNLSAYQQNAYFGVTTLNLSGNTAPSTFVKVETENTTPSGACQTGSLWMNSTGGAGTTFYACVASAWVNVK